MISCTTPAVNDTAKSSIISSAVNRSPVAGVPQTLATILEPTEKDLILAKRVSEEIISYTRQHNESAPIAFELSRLHLYLHPDRVEECTRYVNSKLKTYIYKWAHTYIAERLGACKEFFIDREVYIRINFPYSTRHAGTSSRVTHPDHRLSSYNHFLPKAYWTHGPHKDSWYGHSLNALNFWMALTDLNIDNTMILYPEVAYQCLSFDSKTMYAAHGQDLGNPVEFTLERGQNLLFDPEILHSTRLNTSEDTRVVLTLRTCLNRPQFASSINHSTYDMWVSSGSIEAGRFDPIQVSSYIDTSDIDYIKDNLQIRKECAEYLQKDYAYTDIGRNLDDFRDLRAGVLYTTSFCDVTRILIRNEDKLFSLPQLCPHLKAPLSSSKYCPKSQSVLCQGHGLRFRLDSDSSSTDRRGYERVDRFTLDSVEEQGTCKVTEIEKESLD